MIKRSIYATSNQFKQVSGFFTERVVFVLTLSSCKMYKGVTYVIIKGIKHVVELHAALLPSSFINASPQTSTFNVKPVHFDHLIDLVRF